jgi:RNA polymerase sigma factor (TIGR02999 family)
VTEPHDDVTGLLARVTAGDREAANQLVPLVYGELRRIAAARLARERANHTLQPTALVNEAYLKLVDQHRTTWKNRAHFFAAAANIMRRVLVDHARAHRAEKRGGALERVTLTDDGAASPERDVDLVALDEVLGSLGARDAEAARLVELKFFAGLTTREIAEVLSVSVATVERDWATTRAWLYRAMTSGVRS